MMNLVFKFASSKKQEIRIWNPAVKLGEYIYQIFMIFLLHKSSDMAYNIISFPDVIFSTNTVSGFWVERIFL